ncbi:MAG: YihY/virulence factor BrkB family protein [Phenylobacterium sp.]
MNFGRVLHPGTDLRRDRAPTRTQRKAKPAREKPGIVFDRATALGVGVLMGLATVAADRWRAQRVERVHRSGPMAGGPAVAKPRVQGSGPLAIARCTWAEFTEDRIPAVAAGATFYALLALFPALGVFVSLYGLMADVHEAQKQIAALHGLLPEGGVKVLSEQINRLAAAPKSNLGFTFVLSLILSVWSANAGMKGLIAGLNVAYEEHERRNFLVLNLVSLAFTAGGILFAVAAIATVVAVPELLARIGLGGLSGGSMLRWPIMLVVTAGLLSVVYRFAPSHEKPMWRWITPGGVLAALLWGAMSAAFSFYVGHWGHYDKTYGSLGALAGFMTWIWLSIMVILLGAELNCELDRAKPKDEPNPV